MGLEERVGESQTLFLLDVIRFETRKISVGKVDETGSTG